MDVRVGPKRKLFSSVQFSHSVVSDSLWSDRLQHPCLPVHHQLPEFTQTHSHWVGDAIQSSHPLSSPFPTLSIMRVGPKRRLATEELMLLNCSAREDFESPLDRKEIKPVNLKRKSTLNIHLKDWCWSWSSNTLATWCKGITYWKRHWERLQPGGDRGWDGWMESSTQWT